MHSKPTFLFLFLLLALATVSVACGSDSEPASDGGTSTSSAGSESSRATATSSDAITSGPTSTPSPKSTPALKHPGVVLELEQGDFWRFRWEFTDQSCSQGRGCSGGTEEGTFTVTLGEQRTIGDVELFAVSVTGKQLADDGAVDLASDWNYIGADGTKLLGSDGFSVVTIFDALDGEWTGGGFFSRFGSSETHVARPTAIGSQPFAEWPGVRSGPAVSVVRSDSESMCEVIEGRRICPRDQAFSVSETQYYQDTVGPVGYTYRFSASFSGGGFFSSNSSEETVALVASSLRGDTVQPTPTPIIIVPTPTLTPTPELELDVVFGPQDGSLSLININNEIPDFETGVDLAVGVVDVTFVNPDVGTGDWSYGITFRHSEEETFHAVYVTSNEQWQHFSRGGTAESQVSTGLGNVDLNLGVGAENTLFVAFNLDVAGFFVNGELIAELDLTTTNARASGDVRVIAGVLDTDTYNGTDSEYFDLTVLAP